MAIANGYTTLAAVKALRSITSVDSVDDGVIEAAIEQASRYVDAKTGRRFYASTETHYFSVPVGRELRLDDDLLSVTTLTNGNGSAITSSDYYLLPRNKAPYYAVVLKPTATTFWQGLNGDDEYVISLAGSWGYSATAPMDIREAVELIVTTTLNNRYGRNIMGAATITAAGVVITPQDVPQKALDIIRGYRRLV